VLLLEAGGNDGDPVLTIPAGIVRVIGNPRFDWTRLAEPDPSRGGKVDLWPAGKVLGGSSAINGMLWVRGARQDFNAWAALGSPGWDWASVAPAFRRAEAWAGPPSQDRGALGPQNVQPLRTTHPLAAGFIAACEAAGLPFNPDYNGATQDGVSPPQASQRRGARASAAAYLRAARGRANLRVETDAVATRLLFDGRRAAGVAYRQRGAPHEAHAATVWLCAGAIGTPALLMRSGVGPSADLAALGIAPVLDAPQVGANLAEHPNANMSWDVAGRTYNQYGRGWRRAQALAQWALVRRGPATSPYPHAVAFYRSDPALAAPDMQLMFGPFAFAFTEDGVVPHPGAAVTVVAALNRPRARGRVRLRSASPDASPVIEHALLGDPDDVAKLVAAGRFVRAIMARWPRADEIRAERLPGRAVQSDADWVAYLRATTFLGYHPCGTCRMAPDGVVDERLRVRGFEGLRVADASIMPLPISGNTNAAAIMIGERAAELAD
jgi:choline dehydrogenase